MYMNGTVIYQFFSLPQVIENSRQYLLLRTDILQKSVLGCPWYMAGFARRLDDTCDEANPELQVSNTQDFSLSSRKKKVPLAI